MTTHHIGAYIVHADSAWNNGNSPTGLALAVHRHQIGAANPCHVVHSYEQPCEMGQCSA